jgi:3-methylcrotonyl-CoA carboxylase alpha subunit
MFDRILIANRGEIACRVMATARRLGVATVAVYSEADRDALHVRLADDAVPIGPAPAAQSYLRGERILEAARRTGAQAIHPGYGFLSENADFARACEDAGIVFIGPSAEAIEAMGSKARAKAIMGEAGVPLIPGYHGDDQADVTLRAAADDMGYPVLLKATAGGGGKGMRAVHGAAEFDEALAAARREAGASFGDERMLIEKLIRRPRHVEVQVFCDSHGHGVYLSDRDCSIQRRHQKVIEEAPAPGLLPELRAAMGRAAVEAARAIDYRGAGTVEFLLDESGRFYFMEMNTRLQVEHPVTEAVTGQDLVEWQLRVAAGEPLPLAQAEIHSSGHAIEARIYAEDPQQNFMPATGRIHYLRTPAQEHGVRIDSGVIEGSEISPHYDPMIAKLIVHSDSREEARRRLARALQQYRVAGLTSNIPFLYRIVASDGFRDADLDTAFIERHADVLFAKQRSPDPRDLAAAALVLRMQRETAAAAPAGDPHSPWAQADGWRMNQPAVQRFRITAGDTEHELLLRRDPDPGTAVHGEQLEWQGRQWFIDGGLRDGHLVMEIDGRRQGADVAVTADGCTVFWADDVFAFRESEDAMDEDAAAAGDAGFAAPMHGTVVAHVVAAGSRVEAGDPVVVIEAMKMEQTLRAPVAGTVDAFLAAPGDIVDRGASLVAFTAAEAR